MNVVSQYAMPVMIVFIIVYAFAKKTNVYGAFTLGAGEGLRSVVSILPSVMGLFAAIGVFRASGAMDILGMVFAPLTDFLGIPNSLVNFALLRPVSGSGSLAMANDIFLSEGVDTFSGKVVSVMMGSTETTFYTLAVYFGAVGIKKSACAAKCALFADFVCFVVSIWVCRLMM